MTLFGTPITPIKDKDEENENKKKLETPKKEENINKPNIFEQSISLNNNQFAQTTKEIKIIDNVNNNSNSPNNNNRSGNIFTFDNELQNSKNNSNCFNYNIKNINHDDINKKI